MARSDNADRFAFVAIECSDRLDHLLGKQILKRHDQIFGEQIIVQFDQMLGAQWVWPSGSLAYRKACV